MHEWYFICSVGLFICIICRLNNRVFFSLLSCTRAILRTDDPENLILLIGSEANFSQVSEVTDLLLLSYCPGVNVVTEHARDTF